MAMLNKDRVKARLARIPAKVRAAVDAKLKSEVADLAEAIKRAMPVGDEATGDRHPGLLRDSVHFYQNPSRELSYRVLADARDPQGRFIGPHIEFGHRTAGGTHVPASPAFFPTYRARKRGMRRRIAAAAKAAFKEG